MRLHLVKLLKRPVQNTYKNVNEYEVNTIKSLVCSGTVIHQCKSCQRTELITSIKI